MDANDTTRSRLGRAARAVAVAVALAGAAGLGGCAKLLQPEAPADSAVVHTAKGEQLLEAGDPAGALEAFDRALALDPEHSPAHAGRAVALAQLDRSEEARDALEEADDSAVGDAEEVGVGVATIRVEITLEEDDWLDEAEDAFDSYEDEARAIGTARLHTWMGQAYFQGGQLSQAAEVVEQGLGIDRDFPPASRLLKEIHTAREALAGMPEEYLAVATTAAIDRADVAAIFSAELELDTLLDRPDWDAGSDFRAPSGRAVSTVNRRPWELEIRDADGHWAKAFMQEMVDLEIMEVVDGRFDPDREITKVEFAMLLDRIITKVTGESATKGLGGDKIFADVPSDHFGSAAVVLVTSRGFLAARPDGRFGIREPVSGAVALDSVRKVRDFFQNRYRR